MDGGSNVLLNGIIDGYGARLDLVDYAVGNFSGTGELNVNTRFIADGIIDVGSNKWGKLVNA